MTLTPKSKAPYIKNIYSFCKAFWDKAAKMVRSGYMVTRPKWHVTKFIAVTARA